jgi:hypothetical protein
MYKNIARPSAQIPNMEIVGHSVSELRLLGVLIISIWTTNSSGLKTNGNSVCMNNMMAKIRAFSWLMYHWSS